VGKQTNKLPQRVLCAFCVIIISYYTKFLIDFVDILYVNVVKW